ncbi:hypothetical protein SAMN05444395_10935 [Flavobacterium fryxellicola]|nr:hypothetical protein SAMN05444395_10935 [Flavobacterium fryxellicola]
MKSKQIVLLKEKLQKINLKIQLFFDYSLLKYKVKIIQFVNKDILLV